MNRKGRLQTILKALMLCFFSLCAYHLARFGYEEYRMSGIAGQATAQAHGAREKTLAVQDAVTGRLSGSLTHLPAAYWKRRRFTPLRPTAWTVWRTRQGLCGEATRLTVNLLRHAGVPARRIYLYNRHFLWRGHVAFEYFDGRKWIYGDVFNAAPGCYAYARTHRKPLNAHLQSRKNPLTAMFTDYSYFHWKTSPGGGPYYQHWPLPRPVGMVLENPPLFKAVFFACLALSAAGAARVTATRRTREGAASGQ